MIKERRIFRHFARILGATLLLSISGCQTNSPDGAANQAPDKVADNHASDEHSDKGTQAGLIAKRLAANPDDAASTLSEAGMTWAQYEALLFEVAQDPELTKSYQAAR